jgi:predicted dehydrogenase
MNRREFLYTSSATTAAMASAKSYAAILGANDRVSLGVIGLGRRGTVVGGALLQDPRARIVALSDVYGHQATQYQARFAAHLAQPSVDVDYHGLLARKDVDAVLIATPDHLHVQIACDSLRAGKHVYLEKPTVHDWKDRVRLQAAAGSSRNVLQCGMQQRSGAHYARAKQEFFDAGKLGDVVLVRAVWSDFPWQRRDIGPAPKPADLDWPLFLGPAPSVPYEYVRYTSWRSFPEYGKGVLADILTHWADVAQWMLNDSNPQRAASLGGIYNLHQERDNPDTVSAIVQYKQWNLNFESSVLSIRDDNPSVYFEGTKGLLNLTREGYVYTPSAGDPIVYKSTENLDAAHAKNFLDAVITQTPVSAPLSAGLAATLPVELALHSYWSQKIATPADLAG